MSQEIVDLDAVVGPPRKVKIDEHVYLLPADLPTEMFLRITQADQAAKAASEDGESDGGDVQALRDEMLELFQVHQPDLNKLPGGLTQLALLIPAVYFDFDAGSPGKRPGKPKATKPARAGRRSTSRKPAGRSRS